MTTDRHLGLDAIRGVAVLGILLLNIFNFAMPVAGYINPRAYGGTGPLDVALWAINFVLFEAKMRGLFSILFGAGLALVYDRAQARGEHGAGVHLRRLFWLGVFGLLHRIFVWEGDILVQYAIVGTVIVLLLSSTTKALGRWAAGFLVLSIAFHCAMMGASYFMKARATAPEATTELRTQYRSMVSSFAAPGAPDIARDLKQHRADYPAILAERTGEAFGAVIGTLMIYGLETAGLMALGALLLRTGFLTGGWTADRYRRWAVRAYLLGIAPLVALAWWNVSTDFEPHDTFATYLAWAEPFKYAVTIGHAALLMLLIRSFAAGALTARVAAAGRMAFTNYLATSIVITTIFYGYGLALYGEVGRAELYVYVFAMWAAILGWSKPWLARYRYGPLEWLWRSLSRWRLQPFRRPRADART